MRANDDIPEDEMLLAEALAAVNARGIAWCSGAPFKRGPNLSKPDRANRVCALGALYLAGRAPLSTVLCGGGKNMRHGLFSARVWNGNDEPYRWADNPGDCGESLGWAFRCAMEGE